MSISADRARNEFNKGNYLSVALSGGETDWRTQAARGLIGLDCSQAERLSEFDGEEASFYCAVLHWMDGNEKAAIPILERSSLPPAQRLLNILAAPKLRVISQMIEGSPSPIALFRGASCDERFELTNIDFWPHPDKSSPSADVTDYLDSPDPPVFFISSIVEWNPLLDKMEQLGCPVFGHVTDYDMAFQTLLPSLQRFDEIIVGGEKEHTAIKILTGKQATVYPHCPALDDNDLPELSQLTTDEVDIDVIMTGTLVDYFHPDKREFLSRVLKCRDVDPLFVHGFLPKKFYFQVYRRARIVTSFNRWLNDETFGQTEWRSLEALAAGRPIFSRRGSVLAQFASDEQEIYQYKMETASLGSVLARAINKEKLEPLDRKSTAKRFRQLYSHQNIGSRYLRFLTFRAAMNERRIRPEPQGPQIHQRVTGWTGFPRIPVDLREKTMSILSERCSDVDDWQSRLIAAREFILSAAEAGRTKSGAPYVPETLKRGSNLLREIILTKPHLLAARFNLIRALLHLGDDLEKIEALNLLNETLAGSIDQWELDQLDHVMPFDFFPHMFDYRNYLYSLAELGGGIEEQNRRKKMVLASLNAYLGWFDGNARHFHEAKRLNPDFINYRFWSARADVIKGAWSNVAELKADLETASFDPLTCQQATQLLWTFREKIYENGVVPQEIEDFANRTEQCLLYGGEPEGHIGSIYNAGWHLPGNTFNNQYTDARSGLGNGNTVLTVIIAPRPRRNYHKLLDSLAVQTLSKNKYSVVWAEPFGVLSHDQPDVVDENVCCGQMGVFDHLNRCYNLALSRVISPIVLIIDQTAPLPDNFLAVIVETFINGPEGPLVIATGESGSKSSILENLRLYQESTVAFRTNDLVSVGGFDESPPFYGLLSGPFDAAHRIALQPGTFATIDTSVHEKKIRRCHHAFVAEFFESLYDFKRTLPHVEKEDIRKLRKGRQN